MSECTCIFVLVLTESKEDRILLELEIQAFVGVDWDLNSGPLKEQQALLTAKLFLQPPWPLLMGLNNPQSCCSIVTQVKEGVFELVATTQEVSHITVIYSILEHLIFHERGPAWKCFWLWGLIYFNSPQYQSPIMLLYPPVNAKFCESKKKRRDEATHPSFR